VGRLHRNEQFALAGALLLVVAVFLTWYRTDPGNPNALIDGDRGSFSAFEAHPILRWLLLLAAVAPIVLTYIIARGHKLSWARGEMTMVTSIAAFGLVLYNGVIDRPGEPSSAISLRPGWWLALAATLLMTYGAAKRSSESERPRKPPGTI